MLAKRISPETLTAYDPAALVGAVLLATVRLSGGTLRKGTRLDAAAGHALVAAARTGHLSQAVRLAWPEPDDWHEDDAAEALATAALGAGVKKLPPRQSRVDLAAVRDGVLYVQTEALVRLNSIDPLELFTLFNGQVVEAHQVVGSVKVAPHLIPGNILAQGIEIARGNGLPLIEVRSYEPQTVAAIVTEALSDSDRTRFESGARLKLEALGAQFSGATVIGSAEPDQAEREIRAALERLVLVGDMRIVLVGGVSAGDPLAPFFAALKGLGGRVLRHGLPAHPGSMIWLAELGNAQLLGLPQCGMFSLATAADLVLPRLLTGERLTAASLAELAHGGLLGREMRFRFPPYARDLDVPES